MSETNRNQFEPNYAVPPGAILQEWLDEHGLTQVELAQRVGKDKKTINMIIQGEAPLSAETALQLEKVTGVAASLWNNLEVLFRAHKAAEEDRNYMESCIAWLSRFSYKAMAKLGWVPDVPGKLERLDHLLRYYGVASFRQWEETYAGMEGAARESAAFKSDLGDLSAWLRQGEILAGKMECGTFDEAAFRHALQAIRILTATSVGEQNQKLVPLCARAGVVVVFVPELPKTHVNGFTRWLTPTKALIQLSLRHKRNDHLWFTFFHEAAHILLHGKKERFLEYQGKKSEKEQQADDWASDFLIPRLSWTQFMKGYHSRTTDQQVRTFARELGIAPGIVAGRIQRETGNFTRHHGLLVKLGLS